ncbi:glycosyltransferase [Halarcobacter sp.]|uniref:glycosyltransferase n=1 Tax=Halarcobacter sp. TaxID=2321133 RepID=UPI003A902AEB
MVKVLHLTHTDINSDSRILKEMQSIANMDSNINVKGIGVVLEEEVHKTKNNKLEIHSIILKSRNWRFLPNVLRHTFSLIELTSKMIFKALKFKPHIIHCNDTLVLPLGVIIKLFSGAKLIYDAHELESNRNGLSNTLSKLTLFIEKLLWRFVDNLIVVSPSISNWYQKNIGIKSTEIIMNAPILSGYNLDVKNDKSYFRNKFNIPDNSKIFLYIGILGEGRGIDLLIEAFKKTDLSSHLVFLGYGEFKDKLVDLSKKYQNIHVHNAVPHNEVVAIAKAADVGLCFIQNVSLSDYYCLPNKLFEYAFAEIPILASKFPDISMIVEKYNLGKCSDLNSESIYTAILEFEKMEELPTINKNNLYDLSWSAQEEKLINMYKNLIENISKEKK